ncbi:MAG TPA: hypothetical protein VGQ47_03380 [Candidatus Limnocylindrales bacterium]|nr:hypothetical protein [Candidatus Limnocylindrales bacterium]
MSQPRSRRTHAPLRRAVAPLLALVATAFLVPAAETHAPDPVVGGALWTQNQLVEYAWRVGQVPPAWLQGAIVDAAADSNASRAARAARFALDGSSQSLIAYGEPTGCSPNGIACFNRAGAPDSFAMWFRRQGYVFDWGTLRWCQAYLDPPDGCFDAENIALDEFGHVEVLGHHGNYSDGSDFDDAVVQTVSRAKPRHGWDAHRYGRCDVATLQLAYDVPTLASPYSTCLDLVTGLSLAVSATSVPYRATVTFSSRLWVSNRDDYERLAGNPVSERLIRLQRRPIGGSTWTTVATLDPDDSPGSYAEALSLTASGEYRARFSKPPDEGLRGDDSAFVAITVAPCTSGCPVWAP